MINLYRKKYFHSQANYCKKLNAIRGLFNDDGVWKAESQDILEIIEKSLLDMEVVLEKVQAWVSPEMNDYLLCPYAPE